MTRKAIIFRLNMFLTSISKFSPCCVLKASFLTKMSNVQAFLPFSGRSSYKSVDMSVIDKDFETQCSENLVLPLLKV